jgi:hypothetical protein
MATDMRHVFGWAVESDRILEYCIKNRYDCYCARSEDCHLMTATCNRYFGDVFCRVNGNLFEIIEDNRESSESTLYFGLKLYEALDIESLKILIAFSESSLFEPIRQMAKDLCAEGELTLTCSSFS